MQPFPLFLLDGIEVKNARTCQGRRVPVWHREGGVLPYEVTS